MGFLVVAMGGETMQLWFMAWLWGEWVKMVQQWPDWDVGKPWMGRGNVVSIAMDFGRGMMV